MNRTRRWVLLAAAATAVVALALLTRAGPVPAQEDQQRWNNDYCLGCHDTDNLSVTLPSGEVLNAVVHRETYDASVHGQLGLACALCHTDIEGFPHPAVTARTAREFTIQHYTACTTCHDAEYTATLDNMHAQALAAGDDEAAVCTDCHGAHDVQHPGVPTTAIPQTCEKCHSEIYDLYADSVHGAALLEDGNTDVPTCTDCHGVHNIEGPAPDNPFRLFSPQICAKCHADEALMEKYGISTNVFQTYISDFHGTTVELFERLAPDQQTNKPVCTDCHGVHHIVATNDPESTVFRENLLGTCQRCHPDATANFPTAWLSHYEPTADKALVVFIVQWFYRIIIPLLIGGMLLWVALDATRRIRRRRLRNA